ncbi:10165_t:CDS:2, partial [Ambispora gerdemannii]
LDLSTFAIIRRIMDPKLVRTFMVSAEDLSSSETSLIVFDIFQSIKTRKASFISLVQALGDYLTNEDASIRAK